MAAPSVGIGGVSPSSIASSRLPLTIGDFDVRFLGDSIYLLTPASPTKYLSGSPVLKYLSLPIPHHIIRMEFLHTDSSDVVSTGVWAVRISKSVSCTSAQAHLYLLQSGNIHSTGFIWVCDEFSEPCQYRFYFSSAGTNRIYPRLFIRVAGGL